MTQTQLVRATAALIRDVGVKKKIKAITASFVNEH